MGASRVVGISVVIATVFATGASAHIRATVTCGETVTASVVLTTDLANCPGTGLVVRADGITIDLGGHTVSGTNAPKSEGIADDGHGGVKILNGTITSFRVHGVALRHAAGASISRLTVRAIGTGRKNAQGAAGILLDHSPGSTVSISAVSSAWDGLVLIHSPMSKVIGSHFDGNGNNGLEASCGSDTLSVSASQAAGNRGSGMVVEALRGADLLGNTLTGNGRDGALLFDVRDTAIRGSRATGNKDGIELYGGRKGSRHNQISEDKAAYNAHAGIWVHGDNRRSGADSNGLSGNFANHNGLGGGILVGGSAARNDLFANTANANRGRGITAVAGTIDGGSNRASENRGSPQCLGVKCR